MDNPTENYHVEKTKLFTYLPISHSFLKQTFPWNQPLYIQGKPGWRKIAFIKFASKIWLHLRLLNLSSIKEKWTLPWEACQPLRVSVVSHRRLCWAERSEHGPLSRLWSQLPKDRIDTSWGSRADILRVPTEDYKLCWLSIWRKDMLQIVLVSENRRKNKLRA